MSWKTNKQSVQSARATNIRKMDSGELRTEEKSKDTSVKNVLIDLLKMMVFSE